MFDGEFKTYLDVRQFVVNTYGPLDEAGDFQLLVFLGNAQNSMWADLRRRPFYLSEWTIDAVGMPGDKTYALPDDVAMICSASGTTSVTVGEDEDAVTTVTTLDYTLHVAGCRAAGTCLPGNTVTFGCAAGGALSAQVGATAIVPDDEPDTITVIGYRTPVRSFFTVGTTDDDPPVTCRTWGDIDLEPNFRNVYAKAVVGMMFFGAGDPQKGADWLNLANSEFSELKRALPGAFPGTPAEQGMYQMGTKSYLAPRCCCDPSENWRLTV